MSNDLPLNSEERNIVFATSDPQERAKDIVYDYVKRRLEKTDTHITFARDEVYVVWFAFTLGHWKALLSTSLPDGMYYEVTWNGIRREAYLDPYKKWDNICYREGI